MSTDLARREGNGAIEILPSPKEMIAFYTELANELTAVVEQKKLFTMISGKKHLSAEAWQTVVSLDHANPIIESCEEMRDSDGKVIGWLTKARIEKNG